MGLFEKIFQRKSPADTISKDNASSGGKPIEKSAPKIVDKKPSEVKDTLIPNPSGWIEQMSAQISLVRTGDRNAFSSLINLIFDTPIPVNMPMMKYQDVTKLLSSPGRTPSREIESVQTAGEYQIWHERFSNTLTESKEAILSFPQSRITKDNIESVFAAAGYTLKIFNASDLHSHAPSVPHLHLFVEDKASKAAVTALCRDESPLTTNLLHKIQNKKDIELKTGSCTGYTKGTISFKEERFMAKNELEKRGNPPYQIDNYFA